MGIMIESFLEHGNQSISESLLTYGQSITDECIGWTETADIPKHIYSRVS